MCVVFKMYSLDTHYNEVGVLFLKIVVVIYGNLVVSVFSVSRPSEPKIKGFNDRL